MPRRFITKSDVARLLQDGGDQLVLTPTCTVTDEAMEYARARGMRIVRADADADEADHAAAAPSSSPGPPGPGVDADREAVRAAVIAKLGTTPVQLDDVVDRVLRDHR